MAVALPVVAAIIVLVKIPRRKWYIPVGRVLLAGSLLMAAIFTFALSLQARTSPHGIVNLADLFQETLQNQGLGGFDPLEAVKQLTASISASYPIIEYSTTRPVGLETLIGNANPLPGTSNDFLLERYEPYLWVPLSMVGESYAQLGWFGQLCLYAAVAAVCGFITNNLAASRFYILSLAGAGIGLMIAALSIQYSSRMFWRVFSIAVVLAIVSLLVRERRPSKELSGQITGASRAKREEPTHAGG
jgi:iron complex transport system permease protein